MGFWNKVAQFFMGTNETDTNENNDHAIDTITNESSYASYDLVDSKITEVVDSTDTLIQRKMDSHDFTQIQAIQNSNEFSNSIAFQLVVLKQKLIILELTLPDKAIHLKEQIEYFEEQLKLPLDENEMATLQAQFKEFEQNFNHIYPLSQQVFYQNELKVLQKELDKMFFGEYNEPVNITQSNLHEFSEGLKKLEGVKSLFSGEVLSNYIIDLLHAKYRLNCCYMSYDSKNLLYDESQNISCIFGTFIKDDLLQTANETIEKILRQYKLNGLEECFPSNLQERVDNLCKTLAKDYLDDACINEVSNDSDFMKRFIHIFSLLRQEKQKLDKNIKYLKNISEKEEKKALAEKEEKERLEREAKEKEEQKKQELELYKTISPEQMAKKLKQIEKSSFDLTTIYKNIVDYEKQIARVRGLLTANQEMNLSDMEFIRVNPGDLYSELSSASAEHLRCSYLLDVDDSDNNILIFFSKGKKSILKTSVSDLLGRYDAYCYHKIHGTYQPAFINFYTTHFPNHAIHLAYNKNSLYISNRYINSLTVNKSILDTYDMIQKLPTSENEINDIKVSLEIPYLRPLVPILEELQKEEIEYYMPPFDRNTLKYHPTKKIFIDRKDLAKYEECVHPKISNGEKGIVTIGAKDITIPQLILLGTEIPFVEQKPER